MTIRTTRDALHVDPIADQLRSVGLPPDLERRFQWLTPKQRAVLALQTTGLTWREAAERVGVKQETARRWYANDNYRLVSRGITYGGRDTALTLASAILTSGAPTAALRVVESAESEDQTARESQARHGDRVTILEAVGVIQRTPQVQVVQAQVTDVAAIRALIAQCQAERAAILGHNSTPSVQSALPSGGTDTTSRHNEPT